MIGAVEMLKLRAYCLIAGVRKGVGKRKNDFASGAFDYLSRYVPIIRHLLLESRLDGPAPELMEYDG